MSAIDEKALEAAARALSELHIEASLEKGSGWRVAARRGARAAIEAYLTATSSAADAREQVLAKALRRLAYFAQTSGGTAGRDEHLVAAIDVAIEALRMHDTARAALGSDAG